MDDGKSKARGQTTPTRFFSYYRASDLDELEAQRRSCLELVAPIRRNDRQGDGRRRSGPHDGPARLHAHVRGALNPDFEVLAIDMREFGPSMLLGLSAVCTVSHVEFWDLEEGRLAKDQFAGIVELFKSRVDAADDEFGAIKEMMNPLKSLN